MFKEEAKKSIVHEEHEESEKLEDNTKNYEKEEKPQKSSKSPPPGAVKMPGADVLAQSLNKREGGKDREVEKEEDDPSALLAELKTL